MNTRGVSIIICCHNSAVRLPQTIKHIAEQIVPSYIPWEFIIVNNGSSDNTAELARDLWLQYKGSVDLKIVDEPILGLNHARAKGFQEAQYDYVIMCDDDNWLAADYVKLVYKIMSEKANVAALGGLGKLIFETEPPLWIKYSHIFAAGPQSAQSGKVAKNRVYGAGCTIRKSAYMKLKETGFTSFLADRKGTQLSSGGDYELCYALAIMGYDIWYDERLQFSHFITKERLTWDYFIRYAKESSACFDVLTSYKMIASGSFAQHSSAMVIAKDFLYCLRKFVEINFKRILAKNCADEKLLYFKHVELKHKLVAYVRQFDAIVKNHKRILKFKQACASQQNVNVSLSGLTRSALKPSFSSKLFRQLQ